MKPLAMAAELPLFGPGFNDTTEGDDSDAGKLTKRKGRWSRPASTGKVKSDNQNAPQ